MASQGTIHNQTLHTSSILTENVSLAPSEHNRTQQYGFAHPITTFIEQYTIPVICIFGLLSNTLASVVFLQKVLRKSSCSIFLAARGFSDNGFLSTLLIIWISRTFQLQLGMLNGACMVSVFLSYVCGFMSVWLMVFVTVENYIRICRPFIVNTVCTTFIAKVSVGILVLIAVCFYNFPFWAMTPDRCIPYAQYYSTVQALIYTDTVITLVVPLICITILLSAISCQLVESYKRRKRTRTTLSSGAANPMAKVTKMLLAVTMTFICLNLPSHVNRLWLMISSFVNQNGEKAQYSLLEEAIQQISLLVYYLSLSTNIIVYIIFGSRFRDVLGQICCTVLLRKLSQTRNMNDKKHELVPMVDNSNNISPEVDMKTCLAVSLSDKDEPYSKLIPLQRSYSS